MSEHESEQEPTSTSWPGPALFTVVLALVVAFFWWFVQA
jgi:hypothetical protein